jgi:hypothetical protein
LIIGFLTFLIFLATGAYMRTGFPDLYSGNEVIRFLYRANHVYILFAALLNVSLGLYATEALSAWKKKLQSLGSRILLLVPVIFILAFFIEPPMASPIRPLTLASVLLTLGGMACHAVGAMGRGSNKTGG